MKQSIIRNKKSSRSHTSKSKNLNKLHQDPPHHINETLVSKTLNKPIDSHQIKPN